MKCRFEGWYYKQQTGTHTLALIPGRADGGAFVQVITDARSYNISYPLSEYQKTNILRVGGSTFSPAGVALDIHTPALTLTGELRYTGLTPLRGDIMGPFRFLPMECHHGVVSMRHKVSGAVTLGGETFRFDGGVGYIESDCGRSFPDRYVWVHCNDFDGVSVMASAARIPFCGMRFWGCICAIILDGREYRLATYNGVKITRLEPGVLHLRQGKYRLEVTVEDPGGQALAAPVLGAMRRTIRENAACPARFRFWEGDHLLLDARGRAGYEYAME